MVKIVYSDITLEESRVIVNSANSKLEHDQKTGVSEAICRAAGGYTFQKESDDFIKNHGEVSEGYACHTSAGNSM